MSGWLFYTLSLFQITWDMLRAWYFDMRDDCVTHNVVSTLRRENRFPLHKPLTFDVRIRVELWFWLSKTFSFLHHSLVLSSFHPIYYRLVSRRVAFFLCFFFHTKKLRRISNINFAVKFVLCVRNTTFFFYNLAKRNQFRKTKRLSNRQLHMKLIS